MNAKARKSARCTSGESVFEAARRVFGEGATVAVWNTPEFRKQHGDKIGTVTVRQNERFNVHRRNGGN